MKINKDDFMAYASRKGYSLGDIMDYMGYYENLRSFEYNLNKLKKIVGEK